jgi:hypothetical protein
MMNVIYNDELLVRLHTIRKTTEQFSKEDEFKSVDQLIAEIDMIKKLLDNTKDYLANSNNIIL